MLKKRKDGEDMKLSIKEEGEKSQIGTKTSSYCLPVFTCPVTSVSPGLCGDLIKTELTFSIYSSSKVPSLSFDATRR